MKLIIALTFLTSLAQAQLKPMGVDEARQLLNANMPSPVAASLDDTPTEYSFFNQAGENSVNYVGQVMRQVLISDIKLAFSSLKYGGLKDNKSAALSRLNSYYLYNVDADGGNSFLIKATRPDGSPTYFWEGTTYASLYPGAINLRDKMAGVDNPLRRDELIGWKSERLGDVLIDEDQNGKIAPDEFFRAMMLVTAKNAAGDKTEIYAPNGNLAPQPVAGAYVLGNGLDLAQLAQKYLHGAISLSQAAGDYLSVDLEANKKKGLLADNELNIEGRPYTVMQHHWDEAFGYFGAARNYLEYTDTQIRKGLSIDAYTSSDVIDPATGAILFTQQFYGAGDGDISMSGEKNLGISINAAKRDLGAAQGTKENFTLNVMSSFLKGRQLVQDRPQGYLPYAQAYGVLALYEWERIIAATVIHYINETVADYEKYGSADYKFTDLAKHFSEMKGFALSFQFNPVSRFFLRADGTHTDTDFLKMHDLMRDFPVDPTQQIVSAYKADLLKAREILQQVYEFDTADVEVW